MRTPEEVYQDFSMRRKGILRALTTECAPASFWIACTSHQEARLGVARIRLTIQSF